MSASSELFAWTVEGERSDNPTRFHSRHHRQMGKQLFSIDVDRVIVYDQSGHALVEEKRRGEPGASWMQRKVLLELAEAKKAVPLMIVRAWPERLQWTWSAQDELALELLKTLPPTISTLAKRMAKKKPNVLAAITVDEANHVRMHGLLRGLDDETIEQHVEAITVHRLLQTPGEDLIEYDLAAFRQRPGAYADPVLARMLAEPAYEAARLEKRRRSATARQEPEVVMIAAPPRALAAARQLRAAGQPSSDTQRTMRSAYVAALGVRAQLEPVRSLVLAKFGAVRVASIAAAAALEDAS